jgi:hypothetical protein
MAWGEEGERAREARIHFIDSGRRWNCSLVLFLASPADLICGQVVFIDGGYSAV